MLRLKELREERKWSMRDAAKFLGKSYTTYVNHEKGYREPNSEDLASYAKAYKVSIDYLIGRTNVRTPISSDNNDPKEALRFALYDGADIEITDEMYDEIKRFAVFAAQNQKSQNKKE